MPEFIARSKLVFEADTFEDGLRDYAAENDILTSFENVTPEDEDEPHYIMRKCFDTSNPDHNKVVRVGLDLDEAQAHTSDERTHGDGWMDCYYRGVPVSQVQAPSDATAPLPSDLS